MFLRLFLLFTLIPIAEVWILIRLGGLFGLGPTLLLVIGTGAAGAWLARREGMRSWLGVQSELAQGKMPAESLTHAMLILVAGIVLLTPGVITDLAGILLLIPPVRKGLIARLRQGFERRIEEGSIGMVGGSGSPFGGMSGGSPFGPGAGFGPGPAGHSQDEPGGREILIDAEDEVPSER